MTRWLLLALLFGAGSQTVFGISSVSAGDAAIGTGDGSGSTGGFRLVQRAAAAAATPLATVDVVFGTPPVVGDLIVVAVATWQNTNALVTDGVDTYTVAAPVAGTASQGGSHLWLEYAIVTAAGASTVHVETVAASNGDNETSAVALEYASHSAITFDAANVAAGSAATSPSLISEYCGTLSGVTPGELVVAAVAHDFDGTTSAGTGMTLEEIASDDNLTHIPLAVEDGTAGGATVMPMFDASFTDGNAFWVCGAATFR